MKTNKVSIFSWHLFKTTVFIFFSSTGAVATLKDLLFPNNNVFNMSTNEKIISLIIGLIIIHLINFFIQNKRKNITLNFRGSKIVIRQADIMSPQIYNNKSIIKTISCNEYFDLALSNNNGLIAESSLNGQFVKKEVNSVSSLTSKIRSDKKINDDKHIIADNVQRTNPIGKRRKYKLGTIFKYSDNDNNEVFLTAFAHFDESDRAFLSIQDYIQFLFNFWKEADAIYDGKSIVIPIFASGLTRLDNNISNTQNLQIILWTFWLSDIKFKEPAKLLIALDEKTNSQINYYKIKEWFNALQK